MRFLIQTTRLSLRPFLVDDAADFYTLNADPEVIRYTGDKAFRSIDEARSFLEGYDHYDRHGFGRWAVIRQQDQKYIGWCGLKVNEEGEVDLGFRFFQAEWGKGYATEAAKASLLLGFDRWQIPYIVGRCAPENIGSHRVLQKIGMQAWKQGSCGSWKDAAYYRIDQAQFSAQQANTASGI